jgi:hypothetical protein
VQRLKTNKALGKQASGSGRKDPMPETILGRIGIRVQAMHIFAFAFAAHLTERVIDGAPCSIQDFSYERSYYKFATAQQSHVS